MHDFVICNAGWLNSDCGNALHDVRARLFILTFLMLILPGYFKVATYPGFGYTW